MFRHSWIGVVCGLVLATSAVAQTQLETDEQTLKSHNPPLPTDGKGLLEFFQARSMKEGDAKVLEALVNKLGSDVYREREPAVKELVKAGPRALPFLRSALSTAPLEMKRRAEQAIRDIEASMQSEPMAAAARLLAARKEPKAAEALFNFLPSITTDAFLEEEVLASVGRLTIDADKVDPLILNALKDPFPFRKQMAVYLIGRRAGAEHREKLRDMLADKDARVRERVQQGLYGKRPAQVLLEAQSGDENLLKGAKIDTTDAALLEFFRKRTLNEQDQKRFLGLVHEMGHSAYSVRMRASAQLEKEGPAVLSFLKTVEFDINVEMSRRARDVLDKIREKNNTAIPIAAAHLLARPSTKQDASVGEAIRTLLAYVPFADDDAVEEEVFTCLTLLSLREAKVEPALVNAVDDASPARRAAAAYVLGHVGTKEQVAKVHALLDDLQPLVRFRAAQGLLASRSKDALPAFVNLIGTVPAPYLAKLEETLFRLSEDKGPTEPIHATIDSRAKAVRAWDKWLQDNQARIDLTNLNDRESFLGLITVAEYDSQVGGIQGQVWEGSRGGAKRVNFTGVMGAMDAHTLPNGRILVAENNANRVTERDSKGNIVWTYQTPTNPICCQRLPNGNTFIASYNMVMEIRPDKTEVYRHTPGPQFYIFSAHKAKNGSIVAITAQGQIMELDAKTGQTKHTVQTNTLGNWCSVEMQPNGNYLVAAMSTNSVKEIDRKGTVVWEKQFNGVFRASRLPNGNVLVASMNTREVAEMERSGNIRWRITTQGRPWAIHYR